MTPPTPSTAPLEVTDESVEKSITSPDSKANERRSPGQLAWRRFKRDRTGVISAIIVIFFFAIALAAPLISKLYGKNPYTTYASQDPSLLDPFSYPAGANGGMGENARIYIARAREGSERLGAILTAMGAATRVEEAIAHSERQRFDLGALVRATAEAYGSAFPERRFAAEIPTEPVLMTGAPELIVQMLDKLIDNAVDFSAEGATISVVLHAESTHAELSVANPGPPLPPEAATRLFESLWQSRSEADKRPHFGLGLYIVRLIAEFHGGTARAETLPDEKGARFTVRLAR